MTQTPFGFEFYNQLQCTVLVSVTDPKNVEYAMAGNVGELSPGASGVCKFYLESEDSGSLTFLISTQNAANSKQAATLTVMVNVVSSGGYNFMFQDISPLLINVADGDPIAASLTSLALFPDALVILINLPNRVANCLC